MIRRLAFALVLCLCAAPAFAFEVIANAASWAVFARAAQATGFADAKGVPITNGPLGADGSWFYNAVGDVSVPTGATIRCAGPGGQVDCPEMTVLPGKWVRVRFNGVSPDFAKLVAAWTAFGIVLYQRLPIGPKDDNGNPTLCWSSDGTTCGPAYLDGIGVIAHLWIRKHMAAGYGE